MQIQFELWLKLLGVLSRADFGLRLVQGSEISTLAVVGFSMRGWKEHLGHFAFSPWCLDSPTLAQQHMMAPLQVSYLRGIDRYRKPLVCSNIVPSSTLKFGLVIKRRWSCPEHTSVSAKNHG